MKRTHLKPTVQDRGYAWVIVAASFFIQAIQDGVRFSYGLFFVEFLKEFNKGKGQTAWVGSITLSAFNLQGNQNNHMYDVISCCKYQRIGLVT